MSQQRKTMRAVVLSEQGGPEKLVIRKVNIPTPGPRDVLIKVQYCGVDGHDTAIRSGIRRLGFTPGMIPGHEMSGTVVEVGDQVTTLEPGDLACNKTQPSCGLCDHCRMGQESACSGIRRRVVEGGLAEYAVCPEDCAIPVPEGVDMADAAVAGCAVATPFHAVAEVAQVRAGETVLVTGVGGGLGIHAIQLVRLFGARAIGWTRSESKRAVLESVGIDDLILGTGGNTPVWQQLRNLTGGKGVDVVIDTVGSATFDDAFRGLAKLGRYVMLGELVGKEICINPVFIFSKGAKIIGSISHRRDELFKVLEFIRAGKIKPVIGGVYPLDEINKVHALLDEGGITGRAVMAL